MLPTSSMSSLPWRLTHKFMFWLTTWSFLVFIPLDSLSSRGIDLNFLFFFVSCITCSLSSLSDCDECSELALLSSNCLPFLSLFSLALALEGLFSVILLDTSSNLYKDLSAKIWKLLFSYVNNLGSCCCFWLEHAFSLTNSVGGKGYDTGKLPEWVSFSASATFKRSNNDN